MKIELWCIGKNQFDFLEQGIKEYKDRLVHYCKFEIKYFPNLKFNKNSSITFYKESESDEFIKKLDNKKHVILLDEKGKDFSSLQFASYIENKTVNESNDLIFIIGGAYGFSESLYSRSNDMISLSKMTFSHQLIRLLFVEQLYRAFTIIKNEKYHNS